MKYHIDTIPVWDALHEGGECLLCSLRKRTEQLLVERSLGGSVMSPDTRLRVNEAGFCAHHQQMLYNIKGGNRLGHALMMLSHLQTLRPKLDKAAARQSFGTDKKRSVLGFGRKNDPAAPADTDSPAGKLSSRCVLCEELKTQSQRQTASLLHLWKTDSAFRDAFRRSKGLCIPDTAFSQYMAKELLSGENQQQFMNVSNQLLKDSLARLEEELAWFTQKFDYRNSDKPWGTSKDALERTVNKLRGFCLGEDTP